MKKSYLFPLLLLAVIFTNRTYAQLSCPIDSCDNFSNYFINNGPVLTTHQQAIDSGFYYTIKQSMMTKNDTTVCYAFLQPASGDWLRLQLFVSYPPGCNGGSVMLTGYSSNVSSFSNGNWSSNVTSTTTGGKTCLKSTFTGNIDPGAPNEFNTLGTYEYPNCNQVDTKLDAGDCGALVTGRVYKHCFKIIKSTTCTGDIKISPVITCNGNCLPAGKTCKPIEYLSTVTNSTCPTNANGAIDLTVCANKKLKYLWNDSNTSKSRTGLTPGTYTVTITDIEANSCDTTVSFVVDPEICKGVKLASKTICKGACDTITPQVIGYNPPFTLKWNDGYSNTGAHIVCPATTTTYTVTVEDGITTSTAIATVTIQIPNVVASADSIICLNDSVRLNATGAVSYVWSPSTGLSNTMVSNPLSKPSVAGIYSYVVTGTSAIGCISSDMVKITVINTIPSAYAGPDRTICPTLGDTSITLTASGGNIFTWSTGEHTQSIVVHPTQTTVYTVMVENTCGPGTATDEMKVIVQCGVDIPNVITPNGDPDNQYFYIKGLESYPHSRLEIFDRWGLKMYISENYDNDWDGKNYYQNKQDVSDGVYYYILYLSDKDKTVYTGFVQVIKG